MFLQRKGNHFKDFGCMILGLLAIALAVMSFKIVIQLLGILMGAFPLIVAWIALYFCFKFFIR